MGTQPLMACAPTADSPGINPPVLNAPALDPEGGGNDSYYLD